MHSSFWQDIAELMIGHVYFRNPWPMGSRLSMQPKFMLPNLEELNSGFSGNVGLWFHLSSDLLVADGHGQSANLRSGAKSGLLLSLVKNILWNTAIPVHLPIDYGCFRITMAGLSPFTEVVCPIPGPQQNDSKNATNKDSSKSTSALELFRKLLSTISWTFLKSILRKSQSSQ